MANPLPHTLDVLPGLDSISRRKWDHIRICLEKDVEFKQSNGFDRYSLAHRALPERDLSEIDPSTVFLGKRFSFPFFIEAITGGSPGTERINLNLARAAETMGIGMGVGSQRAMLQDPGMTYTYRVRDAAPNIFLLGNIGAGQLATLREQDIRHLVEAIHADGLAIHLNAAHELSQPEGDRRWGDVLSHIRRICGATDIPVIIKETGCGICAEVAQLLESSGVSGIDVAGAGGTSFPKVEYHRGSRTAEALFEWGIPTAESLRQCAGVVKVPLIASGGIRNGVECAKAIAMGASLAGFALPLLRPANRSHVDVIEKLSRMGEEFKMAMLLAGAGDMDALKKTTITYVKKNLF